MAIVNFWVFRYSYARYFSSVDRWETVIPPGKRDLRLHAVIPTAARLERADNRSVLGLFNFKQLFGAIDS